MPKDVIGPVMASCLHYLRGMLNVSEKKLLSFAVSIIVFVCLIFGFTAQALTIEQELPAGHPRILIFSANIGMGHNSSAAAIHDAVLVQYPNATIIITDTRALASNKYVTWVSDLLYKLLVKHAPKLYDRIFDKYLAQYEGVTDTAKLKAAYNPEKIKDLIDTFRPDIIFSTFNLATQTLVSMREDKSLSRDIPLAWTHTDYVDHDYFRLLSRGIDMTFLAHPELEKRWIKNGVDEDTVATIGMPVKAAIHAPWGPAEKKAFFNEVGLDTALPTVVLSSGAEGVGNFSEVVESISRSFNGRVQIVAVCGRSEENFKNLKKLKLPPNIKLTVEGFIANERLLNYAKSSDVYVTKSGGLSPTEAFIIGKPTVLLDINGGQERYNSRVFKELNLASIAEDESGAGSLIKELLVNENLRNAMLAEQKKYRESIDFNRVMKFVNQKLKEQFENCMGEMNI